MEQVLPSLPAYSGLRPAEILASAKPIASSFLHGLQGSETVAEHLEAPGGVPVRIHVRRDLPGDLYLGEAAQKMAGLLALPLQRLPGTTLDRVNVAIALLIADRRQNPIVGL